MYIKEFLDTDKIESGKRLVLALDNENLMISAAFWFYFSDSKAWRLILGSKKVHNLGSRMLYQKIQKTLKKIKVSNISLENIAVIENTHILITTLRLMISTGESKELADIRFSNNTINGQLIEDAYIYRLQ